MHQFKFASAILVSIIASVILAGCGGGGGSDLPAKPKFTSQVSFGDSLSDVGSYKVGLIAGLGGGQFTINIPSTQTNWTEMTAASLGLSACAAETGLDNGSGAAPGTPTGTVIPVSDNTACTGYAQGGARVTSQPGIGNKALAGLALTVPVVTQIDHHLANTTLAPGGKFTGSELVLVMAGANDVFYQIAVLTPGAKAAATAAVTAAVPGQIPNEIAAGNCTSAEAATVCVTAAIATLTPTVGALAADDYIDTHSAAAVPALTTAATELVGYVNDRILANGAKYVVVANIPDIGSTPQAALMGPKTKILVNSMITSFNSTLQSGLSGKANVLFVDANAASHDEVVNPAKYNLTNVTGTACNLSNGVNPLATATEPGSSLACYYTDAAHNNLNTGVLPTDHYLFADNVHPTPYGHALFATYVLQAMVNKGWY